MSDFAGVRLPEELGGCGDFHAGAPDDDGFSRIECDRCAPALIARHYGFAAKPEGVPATPDERAYREHMATQAAAANADMDVAMRRDFIRGRAEAPSLTEQIRAMSATERAALRNMLGGDEPPAERRGPGRPRTKTTAS
jgi:hypothetical protein